MPKEDGIINWVKPKYNGMLPPDIETDALSVLLRIIIGQVKEDHAKMQYRKDINHYAPEIVEIVRFARSSGYKKMDVENTQYAKAYESVQKLWEKSQKNLPDSTVTTDIEADAQPSGDGIVEDLSFLNDGYDSVDDSEEVDYSQIVDG